MLKVIESKPTKDVSFNSVKVGAGFVWNNHKYIKINWHTDGTNAIIVQQNDSKNLGAEFSNNDWVEPAEFTLEVTNG